MSARSSLLIPLVAALLLLVGAPGPASASIDCPCWDELPQGSFLICHDSPGPALNTFGYQLPGFFYQVTNHWCRVNGQFQWLKSADEALDCRWHLLEACGLGSLDG